jgi:hypothetical protein
VIAMPTIKSLDELVTLMRRSRGPGVQAWVLAGQCVGRSPDNEPLVRCRQAVAWIDDSAISEAEQLVRALAPGEWVPLDRCETAQPTR